MIETVRVAAPNGLLLILDPASGVLPESLGGASVAATASGLAVGALAEFDGETEVCVGDRSDLPTDRSLELRWEGELETSGRLGVLTVYNEILLERASASVAHVEVWTNDLDEPDLVWVAIL